MSLGGNSNCRPSDWSGAGGSRYGNVEFVFNWSDIIEDMKYYWVEQMDYRPPACRILVTSKDYGKKLDAYDPTLADGPWYYDEETDLHYWNSNICLEIMVEDEVLIADSLRTTFTDHHQMRCCIAPRSCVDRGTNGHEAAARFMAALVYHGVGTDDLRLVSSDGKPTGELSWGWYRLEEDLLSTIDSCTGDVDVGHESALSLARAVLGAYSLRRKSDLRLLGALFRHRKDLINSCARIVKRAFGVSRSEKLDSTLWH